MDPAGRRGGVICNHPVPRDLSFALIASFMMGTVGVTLLAFALAGALLVDAARFASYGTGAEDKSSEEVHKFPVNDLPPLAGRHKKYHLYAKILDFYEAWRSCMKKGKRFATIESVKDHEAFREAIIEFGASGLQHSFWIAGTNLGAPIHERDKFYWITNDRPVSFLNEYQNWVYNPTGQKMCLFTFGENNVWGFASCTAGSYYACEDEFIP